MWRKGICFSRLVDACPLNELRSVWPIGNAEYHRPADLHLGQTWQNGVRLSDLIAVSGANDKAQRYFYGTTGLALIGLAKPLREFAWWTKLLRLTKLERVVAYGSVRLCLLIRLAKSWYALSKLHNALRPLG